MTCAPLRKKWADICNSSSEGSELEDVGSIPDLMSGRSESSDEDLEEDFEEDDADSIPEWTSGRSESSDEDLEEDFEEDDADSMPEWTSGRSESSDDDLEEDFTEDDVDRISVDEEVELSLVTGPGCTHDDLMIADTGANKFGHYCWVGGRTSG
jgi:hypothetical protein